MRWRSVRRNDDAFAGICPRGRSSLRMRVALACKELGATKDCSLLSVTRRSPAGSARCLRHRRSYKTLSGGRPCSAPFVMQTTTCVDCKSRLAVYAFCCTPHSRSRLLSEAEAQTTFDTSLAKRAVELSKSAYALFRRQLLSRARRCDLCSDGQHKN